MNDDEWLAKMSPKNDGWNIDVDAVKSQGQRDSDLEANT